MTERPVPERGPGVFSGTNVYDVDVLPTRVIALGASNLTRALYTVVSTARSAWTRDIEFVAALGFGRSYGVTSSVFGRSVPGILESGLWAELDAMPQAPAVGLITDVGNDIMYNIEVPQILDWIRESVSRLERHTMAVTIAGLPVEGERRISERQFRWLRNVVVPSCRLTRDELHDRARLVNDGLRTIAAERGHRFVALESAWYGFDPIHIRHRHWRTAWSQVLDVPLELDGPGRMSHGSLSEAIGLHLRRPKKQWLFGRDIGQAEQGAPLSGGGRVWLF